MEMVPCGAGARSPEPYPDIHVRGRDPRYARAMLSNIGGVTSEMSAVALYLYDHLVSGDTPTARIFREISVVEMHHLEIFSELAMQLGADPRLWSVQRRRKGVVVTGISPV